MNILNNIIIIILYPLQLFTSIIKLKKFLTILFLICLVYFIIGYIYIKIYKTDFKKFFKITIYPIIGIILMIIQTIVNIFYIPYNIYLIIKETFNHIITSINIVYKLLISFIYAILNIDSYLLDINAETE